MHGRFWRIHPLGGCISDHLRSVLPARSWIRRRRRLLIRPNITEGGTSLGDVLVYDVEAKHVTLHDGVFSF